MEKDIKNLLEELMRRVVPRLQPQKIILFGSYATGKTEPDSDLDLIFVIPTTESTRQKANEIDLLMADRKIPMDFIVLTPEQYERQRRIIGSIARQAEKEGKVIYESAA